MKRRGWALMALCGLALAVAGVGLVSLPLALIAGGVGLAAFGYTAAQETKA